MTHARSDQRVEPQGPLKGLRVLDIATIIAAPMAATLLADYGADVVKVELPGKGDGMRDFPPFKEGKSLWWKAVNRNKHFITLDLRRSEGAELLLKLLPEFDVLIENFRPGTLDGWGLSRESLWQANPRLVILRTTGFGQTGPYSKRPGFARVFEALGGLTFLTGEADGEPMHPGYPIGDAIGGLFGAVGILAALCKRVQTPDAPGEEIDLSMTEAVFRLLDFLPIEYDQLGVIRSRAGNANQYSAPAAVYRTADGHYVSLSGSTNALFAANSRAIGREDLLDDPRFTNNPLRVANAAELNDVFSAWVGTQDLQHVLDAFEATQGTIAPIHSIAQIARDPQMVAREAIVDVPDSDFGWVRLHNVVPRFRNDPCLVRSAAGDLGQDNAEIYGLRMGITPERQHDLSHRGVI
ncbi:CaiB/BaiF CoA transferase family protein [Rhodoferax sediminis]|uniref:CoA transferase n=1 Tax=Rhodoferax sediminis TaxID=2509614 RepID=A0A515DDK6_9BURK|nr:CoA transferase [Rhodoferax sediminis]QDL38512.1 CoA transferase [Rhodoferax sediminis]